MNSLDKVCQNPQPKASIGNFDNSEEFNSSSFNMANALLPNLTIGQRRRFKMKNESSEDINCILGNRSAIVVTMSPLQRIRQAFNNPN